MAIRILLVDDQEHFLFISKEFLETTEPTFVIRTVTSGRKALDLLASEHFDIVISDCHMPGMDGLELLVRLRNAGNVIPFIMFSSETRKCVAAQAFAMGADYFLKKGFDAQSMYDELARTIWNVINHQRMSKAARRHQSMAQSLVDAAFDGMVTLVESFWATPPCFEVSGMFSGNFLAGTACQMASLKELVGYVEQLSGLSKDLDQKITLFKQFNEAQSRRSPSHELVSPGTTHQ